MLATMGLMLFMMGVQAPAETVKPTSCIAVQPAGSSMFKRTILYGGLAAAISSKENYKVVAVANYPAKAGDKFKGADLEMIKTNGTKVVLVGGKASKDEIANACS